MMAVSIFLSKLVKRLSFALRVDEEKWLAYVGPVV
jgi:hypothetical protein